MLDKVSRKVDFTGEVMGAERKTGNFQEGVNRWVSKHDDRCRHLNMKR